MSNIELKIIPKWYKSIAIRCYFCGDTRSVKYFANLKDIHGDTRMSVNACNRCALRFVGKDGADND